MRIKVYVIELSARGKRNVVLGGALVIVAATALPADANVPNQFSTGDVLSASKMNADFADIDAWRGHPVVTHGGKQWSLGAAYCGSTAATNGQITGGYAGAKSLCETACASPSAHMCTAEELVRTVQMGAATGAGWYADGVSDSSGAPASDCNGWTSSATEVFGMNWAASHPSVQACSYSSYGAQCCD